MLTGDAKPWEATVNALRTGTPEPRPPESPPPPAPCPVQNGEWTERGGEKDGQVRRARLPGTGGGGDAWSSMSRRPSALSPLLTCPSPPSAPPPAP